MKTLKGVKAEQKQVVEIRGLVEVYEDMAAKRMQEIRAKIVSARSYYDGLRELLLQVGADVGEEAVAGSEALVWISADSNLFGEIIIQTREKFLTELKNNPQDDVWVVGKLGAQMMNQYMPNRQYFTIDLPDESMQKVSIEELALKLKDYQKIKVIYGVFENIVHQESVEREIVGMGWSMYQVETHEMMARRRKFLYEPSYKEVAQVFGGRVMTGVMRQMVVEAELSKFASRIMHLDQAMDNIDESLGLLKRAERKIKGRNMEKKQHNMISGMLLREGR
ncbi:MAG: F0F1 ATP synthase subunit gamma [bacterium]